MQYEQSKDSSGKITENFTYQNLQLIQVWDLERVIAIKEGVLNNFDSSNFQPIIKKLRRVSWTKSY